MNWLRTAGVEESLSARRAWIEIWLFGLLCAFVSVALRKESVDRNSGHRQAHTSPRVALRKESVDRNVRPPAGPHVAQGVALRKESVDRNLAL